MDTLRSARNSHLMVALGSSLSSRELFARVAADFLGLDRRDPVHTLDGGTAERRRVYLDTTATSLMPRVVWDGVAEYLSAASANSHTEAHRAGRDTTAAIEDSRAAIGRLVGADPGRDVVLFTANGATGAINFLARALFPPELRPVIKRFVEPPPADWLRTFRSVLSERSAQALDQIAARPLVLVTEMEHHSNLLPWMEAVGHHNLRVVRVRGDGTLDLEHLAQLLEREAGRVRLVAVTAVSNVTGIINPVHRIAALAHEAGAQILVDGAQWVPHSRVRLHTGDPAQDIDYLVLSGHKLYAPGSRGALVGNLHALTQQRCISDVGGGMVEYVSTDDFIVKDQVTAREEPGTPNIPGTIAMGLIAELLDTIGMDVVEAEEEVLTARLLSRLEGIRGVRIAGSTDLAAVPRAGVISFDVAGLPHGLVAAYLNDFHDVAVRNGCFCAQPYVKALLHLDCDIEERYQRDVLCGDRSNIPGLVRASLGLYSTADDVEALGEALEALVADADRIAGRYQVDKSGAYHLADAPPLPQVFSVEGAVRRWATRRG